MEAFPDAKVVLTVREPEKWYHSVKETIYYLSCIFAYKPEVALFMKMSGLGRFLKMGRTSGDELFEAIGGGQDSAVEFYESWVKEVKSHVPPERLLVFSVKEGWGPLCRFLDLPIPEIEFPNRNDRAEMMDRIWKMQAAGWFINFIFAGVIAGLIAVMMTYIM